MIGETTRDKPTLLFEVDVLSARRLFILSGLPRSGPGLCDVNARFSAQKWIRNRIEGLIISSSDRLRESVAWGICQM